MYDIQISFFTFKRYGVYEVVSGAVNFQKSKAHKRHGEEVKILSIGKVGLIERYNILLVYIKRAVVSACFGGRWTS